MVSLGGVVFLVISFLMLEWARITNPPQLNTWQQAMVWFSATVIGLAILSPAWALTELVFVLPKLRQPH